MHKDSVFVCIITEDGELFQEKFGVLTPELEQMRRYLQDHGTTDVCMESTSVYWIPVWNVLEGHFNLKLVNPYFIRQLPGRKSDIKDAVWIATCLMKDLIRGSYVPESIVRQLRQYNRMIFDLNKEISRKLVKLDACVQRCNIRLSNYVSTVDSKGYQSVVRDISEGVTDPGKLLKRVHRRTVNRWGRDTILASLCGVITETDCDIMRMYLEELDIARAHLAECQRKMTQMCREHFPKHFQRIQTMPGVGERSATAIIAEVGVDMTSFETAAALVSWAGLKPRNDESAGKIKSRRRERRENQIPQNHTWKQVPAQVDGGMLLGRREHPELLLQSIQLYADCRKTQEQDEGPGGNSQENACGSVAHPLRGCRIQGVL